MKMGNIFGEKAKSIHHPLVMSFIRFLFSLRTAGSIFFFFSQHILYYQGMLLIEFILARANLRKARWIENYNRLFRVSKTSRGSQNRQCRIRTCFSTVWTVWAPKKNRAKEVILTIFPCIFPVKTEWNSLQMLKNKTLIRRQISFPQCIEYRIFSNAKPPRSGFFWYL